MNLKNGYKVMYEVIEGTDRCFYVSASDFAHKEFVTSYPLNSVKAIYQDKDHKFYGFAKDGSELDLTEINALFEDNGTIAEVHPDADVDGICDVCDEQIVEELEIPAEPEKTEEPENTGDEEIPEEGTEEV